MQTSARQGGRGAGKERKTGHSYSKEYEGG